MGRGESKIVEEKKKTYLKSKSIIYSERQVCWNDHKRRMSASGGGLMYTFRSAVFNMV